MPKGIKFNLDFKANTSEALKHIEKLKDKIDSIGEDDGHKGKLAEFITVDESEIDKLQNIADEIVSIQRFIDQLQGDLGKAKTAREIYETRIG